MRRSSGCGRRRRAWSPSTSSTRSGRDRRRRSTTPLHLPGPRERTRSRERSSPKPRAPPTKPRAIPRRHPEGPRRSTPCGSHLFSATLRVSASAFERDSPPDWRPERSTISQSEPTGHPRRPRPHLLRWIRELTSRQPETMSALSLLVWRRVAQYPARVVVDCDLGQPRRRPGDQPRGVGDPNPGMSSSRRCGRHLKKVGQSCSLAVPGRHSATKQVDRRRRSKPTNLANLVPK
jgi:hypothetical protein